MLRAIFTWWYGATIGARLQIGRGSKLVGQDEKGQLDDWYVEHASLALDIQIILRTFAIMVRGDRPQDTQLDAGGMVRDELNRPGFAGGSNS